MYNKVKPKHTKSYHKQRMATMSSKMTPVVAKVLPAEKERFFEATEQIGTTPSNAIRMFIAAFNRAGTFPFEVGVSSVLGRAGNGNE